MFLKLKVLLYTALNAVAKRVKSVVRAVIIAAAIGGLTKLATLIGGIGLDASTAAYVSGAIAYAIMELHGLEGEGPP